MVKVAVQSTLFGYANIFGWIQVVSDLAPDGSTLDWGPDQFPMMTNRGVPFALVGYQPTFYDAPFCPTRPQLHWRADLFLCPNVILAPADRDIEPFTGVRWGFKIASEGDEPELLPIEIVGRDAWAESVLRLRSHFPTWRFGGWQVSERRAPV